MENTEGITTLEVLGFTKQDARSSEEEWWLS